MGVFLWARYPCRGLRQVRQVNSKDARETRERARGREARRKGRTEGPPTWEEKERERACVQERERERVREGERLPDGVGPSDDLDGLRLAVEALGGRALFRRHLRVVQPAQGRYV